MITRVFSFRVWCSRVWGWIVVAGLLALLGTRAWEWASGAPEHVDWRHYWHDAALNFWPAQWAEFAGQPNLLTFRGVHLAAVHGLGVGFERLWLLTAGLAFLCAAALTRLARHTLPGGGGPWLLSGMLMLLLSPAFGANWLIAERFRVVLPAAWFLVAVAILQRGLATRRRVLLAGLCAVLALTTHDGGALAWVALVPLVAVAAVRGERRPWGYVAGWALAFNVLALFVWDEAYASGAGIAMHLSEQPVEFAKFTLRMVGLVLPEPLAGVLRARTLVGLLAFGLLAVVSLAAWRARRDQDRVGRVGPWLACAWFGALASVVLAHRHFPITLPDDYVREIFWPVLLLPIGVVGATAALWPELGARARGPLLAVLFVLGAQQWSAGLDSMAVKGRVLRQSDAQLALAELDGLLTAPPGALRARSDRDYLRGLGCLPRAVPLDGDELLDLPRGGTTGLLQRVEGTVVHGAVVSTAEFVSDLIVLVQTRADGVAHVVALAVPVVGTPYGAEPFAVDLGSLAAFGAGDVLWAVAFDGRRRVLGTVSGRFAFRDGGFVAEEAGR